jgi:hypothetical protein
MSNNRIENEQGSTSLATSGNARVDLFFKTVRKVDETHLGELLEASWNEDALDTLKICFYNRDCRGGKGERKLFYQSLQWVIKNKGVKHVLKNLALVTEYGRWEDLLVFMHKKEKKDEDTQMIKSEDELSVAVAKLFAEQLKTDKTAMGEGKPITLCAKWAPTENCKHDKLSGASKLICTELNVNYKVYRKEYLTPLRAYIKVVESFICAKEFTKIDYNKVPGVAMNKLKKVFEKHDKERFEEYQQKLKSGDKDTKVNAATVEPHDLVRQYFNGAPEDTIIEEQWKVIQQRVAELGTLKDCIVISDVSGSMSGTPMEVAIALGLLISSLTREPYTNQIITFHEQPQFHTVVGNTLHDRVNDVKAMSWGMSTNFQAVFDMILQRAKENKLPQDEMPRRLFVVSDMQFDAADAGGGFKTHYEILQEKYTQAGYVMPQVVFWNVRATSTRDVTNNATDQNVAMISGFSPSILKAVLNGEDFSPFGVLRTAIDDERYKKISLAE